MFDLVTEIFYDSSLNKLHDKLIEALQNSVILCASNSFKK